MQHKQDWEGIAENGREEIVELEMRIAQLEHEIEKLNESKGKEPNHKET
jgi:uncharacterized small protein (DUF1192 family)